jgi:ATP-binding cassette subfamily C protein
LKDFSLTISKGDCIGIVGESGSGKTTLVEILLGLHKTSNGEYYIDNTLIQPNISYNKLFGYVPQNIFLVDDSLNTNIILGREEKPEDTSRLLQNAIKQSELEELINSMSDSRKERVGERGVMLSGGQRQRIGIARALFNNPDILVFDEATASLDIETESKIIESISKLKGQKTIIMVAHRLQSLRFCNRIIALNKGKITFDGNFEDYMNNITDK